MTDEQMEVLKQWIATDLSDYAQRIREFLAPAMRDIILTVQQFSDAMGLPLGRESAMRKKIRRYARTIRR